MTTTAPAPAPADRVDALHRAHLAGIWAQTDRLFGVLLPAQWAAAVVVALVLSPTTWAGRLPATHPHVLVALLLGGLIASLPTALAWSRPGEVTTRHAVAVGQMLLGGLLIHLTGGRIETHFHVFGSLAILAFYRDWPVLVVAAAVTAIDHVARGLVWPQSIYGVEYAPWRFVEHAFWVVVEVAFLARACLLARAESRDLAAQRAAVEATAEAVERRLRGGLVDAQGALAAASARLMATTAAQGEAIARQAAALQQTQVTAGEIRETSRLTAERSAAVLEVARRAEDEGAEGARAVDETLTTLAQATAESRAIGGTIAPLRERAREIRQITETVKALADQSNMLALNAAIEAARSGEHGRGFTVVAREIRSLADQSVDAARRVRELIDGIAGTIEQAGRAVEGGGERLEGGLARARVTGERLRALGGIVGDTTAATRQIAAAVEQQHAGVRQILQAVDEQTRLTEDSRRSVEATEEAARSLEGAARQITELVGGAPARA